MYSFFIYPENFLQDISPDFDMNFSIVILILNLIKKNFCVHTCIYTRVCKVTVPIKFILFTSLFSSAFATFLLALTPSFFLWYLELLFKNKMPNKQQ